MGDDTVVMEWFFTTPCGKCGTDIRIEKDPSRGKSPWDGADPVSAKCGKCGHGDSYPATALDRKAINTAA